MANSAPAPEAVQSAMKSCVPALGGHCGRAGAGGGGGGGDGGGVEHVGALHTTGAAFTGHTSAAATAPDGPAAVPTPLRRSLPPHDAYNPDWVALARSGKARAVMASATLLRVVQSHAARLRAPVLGHTQSDAKTCIM